MDHYRNLALAGFFCFAPLVAASGPFGIEFGDAVSGYGPTNDSNKPMVSSVPEPHPLFKGYGVEFSAETGICQIGALSKFYRNDRSGSGVQLGFKRVREALQEKYGIGTSIDRLRPGSLWDGSGEWVMSLYQNERTFAHLWENIQNDSEPELDRIFLVVLADGSAESFMMLGYYSKEYEKCVESIKSGEDSSF